MSLLLIAAVLAGCTNAPPPRVSAERAAQNQARLETLLAGRVAGPPINCLPPRQGDDMIVIDDNTIVFREGARVYVNRLRGGCSNLGSGFYALVTKSLGSSSLCSGDIARVADTTTGSVVGSCVVGEFVPYTRG